MRIKEERILSLENWVLVDNFRMDNFKVWEKDGKFDKYRL